MIIEDKYGITIIERAEIRYKDFGFGVNENGFSYYLHDSIEFIKL